MEREGERSWGEKGCRGDERYGEKRGKGGRVSRGVMNLVERVAAAMQRAPAPMPSPSPMSRLHHHHQHHHSNRHPSGPPSGSSDVLTTSNNAPGEFGFDFRSSADNEVPANLRPPQELNLEAVRRNECLAAPREGDAGRW